MNSKKISFKAAAKKLLAQAGEPMNPKEITAQAMDEAGPLLAKATADMQV